MNILKSLLLTATCFVGSVLAEMPHSQCVTIITNTTAYTLGEVLVTIRLVGTLSDGSIVERIGTTGASLIAPGTNAELDLSVAQEKVVSLDEVTGEEVSSGCRPITYDLKVIKKLNGLGSWFDIHSVEIVEVKIIPRDSFDKIMKRGRKKRITCYPYEACEQFGTGVATRHMVIRDTQAGITFTPIS